MSCELPVLMTTGNWPPATHNPQKINDKNESKTQLRILWNDR